MSGLAFPESPGWHGDRLWFSDWGAHEVIAVDLGGKSEVIARVPSFPMCVDFLPDGRLLIVSSSERRLVCTDTDGSLATYVDLTGIADHSWNDIIVDGRGNAYINNIARVVDGVFKRHRTAVISREVLRRGPSA
jgi:sugar lactone lactonase YvrE